MPQRLLPRWTLPSGEPWNRYEYSMAYSCNLVISSGDGMCVRSAPLPKLAGRRSVFFARQTITSIEWGPASKPAKVRDTWVDSRLFPVITTTGNISTKSMNRIQ